MGKKLIVHTDHNNFACKNFNTDKILIQRLILREYGPDIEYIKGEKNMVTSNGVKPIDLKKANMKPPTPQK